MVTWTFFLAGLFVAVLCGSIWLFVEADDEAAQTAAAVVDAMVAIALGLLAVRGWLARRRRSPTLEQRDKAARWLAGEMRLRVHDEPTHRALLAPEQVAMRWRVRRPVFSPTGTSDSASGLIDTGEGPGALVDWMSRVRSPRAALIGEPGAGKTTLVALVAQELLQSERRDADDPVPVIVSMADWDPRVATLNRWISLRLAEQFPQLTRPELYGRDAAHSLVEHGQIYPILDGLDEIRDDFTGKAVDQLRGLSPAAPVIVTCRTDKFAELTKDGRLAPRMNTIELEPLAGADVVAFLEAAIEDKPSEERQRWRPLIDRVRSQPGDALTIALDTPLIAWLLWAAYIRDERDPALLLDRERLPSATAIEQHLLRDFLPMALAGRSPKATARAERWLRFLARRAAGREARGLTWWSMPLMVPRILRRAVTFVVALGVTAPLAWTDDPGFFAFFASLLALVPRLEPASARNRAPINVRSWVTTRDRLRRSLGIGGAIAVGVLFSSIGSGGSVAGSALVALVAAGFYAMFSEWVQRGFARARDTLRLPLRRLETADSPPPVVGTTWDWSRAALVVAIGLLVGAALSLPEEDLVAGIGGGLAVTAALSPFVWFGKSSLAAPFQHQREVFRANVRYSLGRGALLSLIVPAVVLALYLADGDGAFSPRDGAASGDSAVLGLVLISALFATMFACASTLISPCGQYAVSMVLLAPARRLPWRLTRFFEDMHKVGVLRRSGMGYEFRHERLRETLVGGPEVEKRSRGGSGGVTGETEAAGLAIGA